MGGIMILEFTKRDVYGRKLYYPVNELAIGVVAITRGKSLTLEELKILIKHGYQVKLKYEDESI